NMFVGRPPGNYDRLLDFSRAVTGTLFFVPSVTFLESVAAAPPAADARVDAAPAEPAPEPDGSLGIGSLKPQGRQRRDCATSSICLIMMPQPSKKPMSSCLLRSASSLCR